MDRITALSLLGFSPDYMPNKEEIEQLYNKQITEIIKDSFTNNADSKKRQLLDQARNLLMSILDTPQPSDVALQQQIQSVNNQYPVIQNQTLDQFYQKTQSSQSPIPMIQVSDFSMPYRTNVNYLRCPFCSYEVAEGMTICPKCNNQVARNCPTCATWISINSQSCPACGAPVAIDAAMKFARSEVAIQTLEAERANLARNNQEREATNKNFVMKSWIIWLLIILLIGIIALILVIVYS